MDFDSDYVVEDYIKPRKIRKPLVNDESADLLGNFDDKKRKEIEKNANVNLATEEDPFASDSASDANSDDEVAEGDQDEVGGDDQDEESEAADTDVIPDQPSIAQPTLDAETDTKSKANKVKKKKKKESVGVEERPTDSGNASGSISNQQITSLMKGASKQNRFVLYVTNLNYDTSKERLHEFFQKVGEVKSVRIPKSRKTAFAFVEMDDISGFKNALGLHNKTLDEYKMKIQVSEGGKKKSANKKNIIKQKNRKLAEMRNEGKQFSRSGKGYDKTIKKEIRQKQMQQERRLAKKQLTKSKPA